MTTNYETMSFDTLSEILQIGPNLANLFCPERAENGAG
jgi:hypothetical protein